MDRRLRHDGDTVYAFENRGSATGDAPDFAFGDAVAVVTGLPRALAARPADVDGDLDVVTGGFQTGVVAWHANDGGGASDRFARHHVLSREVPEALAVHAEDLDRDGDLDVAVVSQAVDSVVWFESALEGRSE